jgi:hypothetical protein
MSSPRPLPRSSRPDAHSASLEGHPRRFGLGRARARLRQRGHHGAGADQVLDGRTQAPVRPALAAGDHTHRALTVHQPEADGRRVAQAGTHHGAAGRRGQRGAVRAVGRGQHNVLTPADAVQRARGQRQRPRERPVGDDDDAVGDARGVERPECRLDRCSPSRRHAERRREAQDVDQDEVGHSGRQRPDPLRAPGHPHVEARLGRPLRHRVAHRNGFSPQKQAKGFSLYRGTSTYPARR